MADWALNAGRLGLTGAELFLICNTARRAAGEAQRTITLGDMIHAYTVTTGRPDEWDLVTDPSLYGDEEDCEDEPEIVQCLLEEFGRASEIPNDGRLDLLFSRAFYADRPSDVALEVIEQLGEFARAFKDTTQIQVIDWGWPKGLWAPVKGCVYRLQGAPAAQFHAQTPPQRQWAEAGFTFGPKSLVDGKGDGHSRRGKPWRRLV